MMLTMSCHIEVALFVTLLNAMKILLLQYIFLKIINIMNTLGKNFVYTWFTLF